MTENLRECDGQVQDNEFASLVQGQNHLSPKRRFTSRSWALVSLSILALLGISSRSGLTTSTTNTGVTSKIVSHYKQDRPVRRLGIDPELYEPVENPRKTQQRIKDMELLEQVRSGHCGRFEEFLAGTDNTTNWRLAKEIPNRNNGKHCINSEAYRQTRSPKERHPITAEEIYPHGCRKFEGKQYVCEAPHPTLPNVTVTIDRYGEFSGIGGYDWSVMTPKSVGDLTKRLLDKSWAFVGGLAAPVYPNGTLIGYPPVHSHHTHVYPIQDHKERGRKVHGSTDDHHNLLLQTHGDTECLEEGGGLACFLTMLDPGTARVIDSTESGFTAEFELNDVRPKGSERMYYYFEIVVMLKEYVPDTVKRSTFMGIINPCVGRGPCTYQMPLDPNSNMLAYHYVHGEGGSDLSSGFMSNFVMHTHQTLMDSAFLFLSKDDAAYKAVDAFRGDSRFPVILECLNGGQYDLESAKEEIFARVEKAGGRLVCEANKPTLALDMDPSSGAVHAYDKRPQLNCLKDPVPLNVGDVLTVVAFNQILPNNNISRKSSSLLSSLAYSRTFSAPQHTIFRFDLTYGDEEPDYAPWGFWRYCDKIDNGEIHEQTMDIDLNTGCPDSITYNISKSKIAA